MNNQTAIKESNPASFVVNQLNIWFSIYTRKNERTGKYGWEHMNPDRMVFLIKQWYEELSYKNKPIADEILEKIYEQ